MKATKKTPLPGLVAKLATICLCNMISWIGPLTGHNEDRAGVPDNEAVSPSVCCCCQVAAPRKCFLPRPLPATWPPLKRGIFSRHQPRLAASWANACPRRGQTTHNWPRPPRCGDRDTACWMVTEEDVSFCVVTASLVRWSYLDNDMDSTSPRCCPRPRCGGPGGWAEAGSTPTSNLAPAPGSLTSVWRHWAPGPLQWY